MGSLSKPHVLAMPFPAQGHMSPLMHVCKIMAAKGFTITYVNVDSIHDQMKQSWVCEPGLAIHLESLPFSWSIPNGFNAHCMSNIASFFDDMATLDVALGELIHKLALKFGPVSAIISDYFVPWTQAVADKFGIPRVIMWTGNAAWAAIEHDAPELVKRGHLPASDAVIAEGKVIDYTVPGLKPLRPCDIPVYMNGNKRWIELTVERAPTMKLAKWVLINSFYEMEEYTFEVMRKVLGNNFVPIGPLFLLDNAATGPKNVVLRKEHEGCIEWLDTQLSKSVLYISFGSICVLTTAQFEELAQALEESGQPFLWVIRSELVAGETAKEYSYEAFCERTKNQGHIISWAPQLRVLAHSSVGGFLTHCGWNSMLESVCNGVPMLGWPWGAEQNFNCKIMDEDWKFGRGLVKQSDGLIHKDDIQKGINLLMKDEEGQDMRQRVEKMKHLARSAIAENAPSFHNLDTFINEMEMLTC